MVLDTLADLEEVLKFALSAVPSVVQACLVVKYLGRHLRYFDC